MASNNLRGAALALMAMGIYATHDVVIKTLGGTYPPLQILFFASLLSFPLVTLILLRDPNPGTLRATNPGWVALRTVCAVIGGMCGFYAFSTTPLAQVYAILFSMPLLITVLSIPLLGEKVGRHRWIAVGLGLIGVLIVLRPGTQALSAGHLAALVAAVTGATAAVIIRRVGGTERPMVLMMWPMLANFVVTGASLGLAYEPMALADMGLSALIAAMGLGAGFLLILAYRTGEAAMVAPMQYSQILWATAYGWFLFGEGVDLPTLIGACVIIASGVYIVWRERRGGNSANSPVIFTRMRTETVTAPKTTVLQRLWRPRA